MKYLLCLLALTSCSGSKADGGLSVQQVAAPLSGYTCFAIINGSGQAIGGNCVKD